MIPEEFVTFETAKLLKEAGFPQDDDNGNCTSISYFTDDGDFLFNSFDFSESAGDIAAPTQAVAMRWLREEKNLIVEPRPTWPYDGNAKCVVTKWCAVILSMFEHPTVEEQAVLINTLVYFPTYEAAAEAGIQTACRYLIKKGGEG